MNQLVLDYIGLNEKEKQEFSRLANRLLKVNYLCRDSTKDRKDYYLALDYLKVLKPYFSLIDMDLILDEVNNVIALKTDSNLTRLNLRKADTIVLLIFRKLFYERKKTSSYSQDITITVEDIFSEVAALGYDDNWINKTEIIRILKQFRNYNIIDTVGNLEQLEITIILLPSILHVLSFENLNELQEHLNKYKRGGVVDETIEED